MTDSNQHSTLWKTLFFSLLIGNLIGLAIAAWETWA